MTSQVYELLSSKGNFIKASGKDYLIKCLNPEHDDSSPSMRVDQDSGIFKCFSCGFSGNIFKYYNVFTSGLPLKLTKLKRKLANIKQMSKGLDLPLGATPYLKPYRGLSVATLKHFEAFYTHQIPQLDDRIVFPIRNILGKIVGFTGRHIRSDAKPKYVYYPSGSDITMFPAKLPKNSSTMVIVEGIFDMMNLYDKGLYNSVCTFGVTGLLNDTKIKLMPYKAQGVSKIYIMYDGDQAGTKSAKLLHKAIEDCDIECEIINLTEDSDPGILSLDEVNSINCYINKIENRYDDE